MFQKLFTAEQIREIDRQTIIRQQITSEELMERAAHKLFEHLLPYLNRKNPVYIFCGKGNNGGDALVLTRLLYLNNYKVRCFTIGDLKKASKDFILNLKKLQRINFMVEKLQENNLPEIPAGAVIIDGIFGTGLNRPAEGMAQTIINYINTSKSKIYSIDVPSGLYVDKSNNPDDPIVKATKVFTFQFPKISFFFPENAQYVPAFESIDIGLDRTVMEAMPTIYYLLTGNIKKIRKKRSPFGHKYTFGHAYIIGGSYGMFGAVLLASKAALRIGAGLVSNFLPRKAYNISQTYIPEVMTRTDSSQKVLKEITIPEKITAAGIGMGMGQHPDTQKALKKFLKQINVPLLLDADALNILAGKPKWLSLIPENSILTPHEGEFKRLAGAWENDRQKWQLLKEFADAVQSIVVLKGAYTVISDGKNFYINPVANPALATAGSGDVLSGMITGLQAQKHTALEAALLGVYLHGQTAEQYIKKYNAYSMTAPDIIEELKSV